MNDTPTNGRDLSPPEQYDEYVKRCIDQRALAICVEAIQPLLDRLITAEGEIARLDRPGPLKRALNWILRGPQ